MYEMLVRPFESADVEGITSMHRKYNMCFEEREIAADHVLQCSLRHDFRFFVAHADGNMAGFIGVLFYESVGRAEVGPLCVEDKFRRAGVGSRMLEHTLTFLKEKRIRRITAKVKQDNQHAIPFFEKHGFIIEALFERYTAAGENVVQLVRFV